MPVATQIHQIAAIYQSAPVALCVLDRELRHIRVNDRLAELTGIPAADHVGRTVREVIPDIADRVEPLLRRVIATGEPIAGVEIGRRARTALLHCVALRDNAGQIIGVNVVIEDVTEHRRGLREQRFLSEASKTLASAPGIDDTIDRLAALGVPEFADWAAVDVLTEDGTLHRQRTAPPASGAAVTPDALETSTGVRGLLDEMLRTGSPVLLAALDGDEAQRLSAGEPTLAGTGIHRPRSFLAVPLIVERRTVGALSWVRGRAANFDGRDLAVAEELVDRARSAIMRAELLASVEQANRMKGQFLATLGHELRQPASVIITALSLLRPAASTSEMERAWLAADRQARHIARLLEDLMDLSRIERGKVSLRRSALDLRAVVRDAVELHRRQITERGQIVEVTAPEQPIIVVGDDARLQQVFSNLVHNAIKFTPDEGRISIAIEAADDRAAVRVRDSGPGIPAGLTDRIFEPFAQADLAPLTGGLGIGLAVVKQLVYLHGGSIDVRSRGDEAGSEFTVHLPLQTPAVAPL